MEEVTGQAIETISETIGRESQTGGSLVQLGEL